MGYRLVSFIGTNAFFVHPDAGHAEKLLTLTGEQAALQNLELVKANKFAREYTSPPRVLRSRRLGIASCQP